MTKSELRFVRLLLSSKKHLFELRNFFSFFKELWRSDSIWISSNSLERAVKKKQGSEIEINGNETKETEEILLMI